VELQEVMWEERPLHKRFFKLGYGGPCYSRMKRYMLDHEMFVKEWVSHHSEMNYHFNQVMNCRHLRSGWSTSLG
jgi:hypothetical protein